MEELVNDAILEGYPVVTEVLPIEEAKKKGAVAMFGEKYGETVRVVEMSDFSVEFCGGTHVDNTAKAGPFRIKSESSVASGVRRIEATCGKLSLKAMESSQGVLSRGGPVPENRPLRAAGARWSSRPNEMKQLRQALEKFKAEASLGEARQFLASAKTVKDLHVLATTRNGVDTAELRTMGDFLRDKDRQGRGGHRQHQRREDHLPGRVRQGGGEARGIKAGDLVRHVSADLRRQGRRQAGFRHGRRQRSPEGGRCAGLRGRFRVREAGLRRKEHPMKERLPVLRHCRWGDPLQQGV